MTQRILVIGGTGMLGEPVVRHLEQQGFQPRVLTRAPEKARRRFGERVEVFGGDVEDAHCLEAAVHGCRGAHINLRSSADPDLERRGAAAVAQAAARAGLERISYLSGASVCAENCWYAGTRAKFEAEAALRASGVPYTIFKATWFMEALNNLVRDLGGKKRALQIGRPAYPYHWVAAEDYARMAARSFAVPQAADKSFFVYGPQALTVRQALDTYCRIAHPGAIFTFMPIWAAGVLAVVGRREELRLTLPFFRYMERAGEIGDAAEANALLGAPQITLEQWSETQKGL